MENTIPAGNRLPTQQVRLLVLLERLLAIRATAVKPALTEAANLAAASVAADKVDIFLHESATETLVAIGTSDTPMGRQERALGLDRLPLANGGRVAEVFQNGKIHQSGQVDTDPNELRGIREALGVKSSLIVPLDVAEVRRGALLLSSARRDAFSVEDRMSVELIARWVGLIVERAELIERLQRDASEEARRLTAEELMTVLAHDLRNYLAPLLARVQLLHLHAEREGRTRDLAETEGLMQGLQRLQHFVADMLDLARIEEGLFALVREPVNLADLARLIATTTQSPDFRVTVDAPAALIAHVDIDRIRQALGNLLANAARHAPGSPVTLRAGTESRVGGEYVVLAVSDRGPGISAHLLPRLTERFVRGARTQGLGLGLYLVRRIAEAHGGKLEAESTFGKGATFRLVLPADIPPMDADE